MKFAFIAKQRRVWPVAWLCEALGVRDPASRMAARGRAREPIDEH